MRQLYNSDVLISSDEWRHYCALKKAEEERKTKQKTNEAITKICIMGGTAGWSNLLGRLKLSTLELILSEVKD